MDQNELERIDTQETLEADDIFPYENLDEFIAHYGTPRHSGRYPWGSGKKYQRSRNFMTQYTELRKSGKSDKDIATYLGYNSISELRARKAFAIEQKALADRAFVQKLKDKGMSNTAIAERMHVTEGTVRNLLKDNANEEKKKKSITHVSEVIGEQVRRKGSLDIGKSNNLYLGITQTKLDDALIVLQDQGYKIIYPKIKQLGTSHNTQLKVLIPPGVNTREAYDKVRKAPDSIGTLDEIHFTENGHGPVHILHEPEVLDNSRFQIRYAEEGGKSRDGTIQIRRGVPDLNLGDSRYAQVRILTDGGKLYMKGMAIYSDDMPDGVDVIFNTNKHLGAPLEKVLKPAKVKLDPKNPFGTTIDRQNDWTDEDGKEHKGLLNIVREEGSWDEWSRNLPSQFLGKQPLELAKKQLDLAGDIKDTEYEKLSSLTNPTLKKKLLEDFADECDTAAVTLKAAAMPRQATKVILPLPNLSEKEVYAPRYENGEEVVLVRFPHQGRFEIPRLTVNNNNREGKKTITGTAVDAVGINPKVAEQLSGADFDGDTVLVIPTKGQTIVTEKALTQLKDFDPKERYARPDGTESPWKKGSLQEHIQMGQISNLITDMTLNDAPIEDIVKATKHALTIIDVGKHNLDYKRSEEENDINNLKRLYQGSARGGASTLLSKAKREERVTLRDENRFWTDPETGKKVWATAKDSERFYTDKKGKPQERFTKSTEMYEKDDPYELSSGLPMEQLYASYATRMKKLARTARLEAYNTGDIEYSPAAAKTYEQEVKHLREELVMFKKNQPIERLAQRIANNQFALRKADNPDLEKDELKKLQAQCLKSAREKVGAKRYQIKINDKEWDAIQSGALPKTVLQDLFKSIDSEELIKRALPRDSNRLSASVISRAKTMAKNNYSWDEIAKELGVSQTALINEIGPKGGK